MGGGRGESARESLTIRGRGEGGRRCPGREEKEAVFSCSQGRGEERGGVLLKQAPRKNNLDLVGPERFKKNLLLPPGGEGGKDTDAKKEEKGSVVLPPKKEGHS